MSKSTLKFNPISVILWTFQSIFIKLVSILKKNHLINNFFNKLCRSKQTVFHADIIPKSKERYRNNFKLIQKYYLSQNKGLVLKSTTKQFTKDLYLNLETFDCLEVQSIMS